MGAVPGPGHWQVSPSPSSDLPTSSHHPALFAHRPPAVSLQFARQFRPRRSSLPQLLAVTAGFFPAASKWRGCGSGWCVAPVPALLRPPSATSPGRRPLRRPSANICLWPSGVGGAARAAFPPGAPAAGCVLLKTLERWRGRTEIPFFLPSICTLQHWLLRHPRAGEGTSTVNDAQRDGAKDKGRCAGVQPQPGKPLRPHQHTGVSGKQRCSGALESPFTINAFPGSMVERGLTARKRVPYHCENEARTDDTGLGWKQNFRAGRSQPRGASETFPLALSTG